MIRAATLLWVLGGLLPADEIGEQWYTLIPAAGGGGVCCVSGGADVVVIGRPGYGTLMGQIVVFDARTREQGLSILPPDTDTVAQLFGASVAVNGSLVAVGAPGAGGNGDRVGATYVFHAETGQLRSTCLGSNGVPGDEFGEAVAMEQNTVLVGAEMARQSWGAAYLFDATTGEQRHLLLPISPAPSSCFGCSVALSGSTAIVGAREVDDLGIDSGAAYIFDTTTGQQTAVLHAADGAAGDNFGSAVAIHGGLALVGAMRDDDNGEDSGSAYLFDLSTGQQIVKILPENGQPEHYFGGAVAMMSSFAVVGTWNETLHLGSAFLFSLPSGELITELTAEDTPPLIRYGASVSINPQSIHVTSPYAGAVYAFESLLSVDRISHRRSRYDRPIQVELSGYGFSKGGGAAAVAFGGVPATNVQVLDDHRLICDTPRVEPGQPDVDMTLLVDGVADTLRSSFSFTPVQRIRGEWDDGRSLELSYELDPGDNIFSVFGLPPEGDFATPPFDGRLCVLPFDRLFLSIRWPFDTWQQTLKIPDDPSLRGVEILFQALIGPSFGSFKDAAWTNCERLVIQ